MLKWAYGLETYKSKYHEQLLIHPITLKNLSGISEFKTNRNSRGQNNKNPKHGTLRHMLYKNITTSRDVAIWVELQASFLFIEFKACLSCIPKYVWQCIRPFFFFLIFNYLKISEPRIHFLL